MIRQYNAQKQCDAALMQFGEERDNPKKTADSYSTIFLSLWNQGWRTIFGKSGQWLARCYHDEKRIVINLNYLQTVNEVEFKNTILHEVAHALVGPGLGHGPEWQKKAKEIGLRDPKPCGPALNLNEGLAINPTEMKPKRQFHRVDVKCPVCSEKAVEKLAITMNGVRWTKLVCGHLVRAEAIKQAGVDYYALTNVSGSKRIYPYQAEGIKFLEAAGGRALIADEPGLGKTSQALLFGKLHKEDVCPILWTCKSTLKLQTLKEALDWCGIEFMAQIIDSPRSFILPNLKLYIISMDLLRNMPSEKLEAIGFKTVVADEIQHFKNPASARTAELRKLVTAAEYFIPLSATPWKNRGIEYFPVLNMLDAVRFPTQDDFKKTWVNFWYDKKTDKMRMGGIKNIPAFREYTKDIVIRRMRDDVLPDLPPIRREIRFIDMENLYKEMYDKEETKVAEVIKAAIIDGKSMQSIGSMIMHLKHLTGLAKVQVTIEDVQEFIENNPEESKLVIYHHHIDVGDNLQQGDGHTYEGLDKFLEEQDLHKTLRLYGGRGPVERDRIVQEFMNNPKCRIMIASTLASGEGLNLQFCQNAIQMERQWNPANEEQAELRFSRPLTWEDYPLYLQQYLFDVETRIPKKISIRVPYMIADGTVDSILTEIVERKRYEYNRSMNDRDADIVWDENEIIKEVAEYLIRKRYGKQQTVTA